MAQNVRFIKTTKIKYLNREIYDENALYFCQDTNEIFKGSQVYTDGIRIVQTKAELPECNCAPDGVVYYIRETRNGYTLSPDRTEWLQTIYAPVEDITTIPESEIYNTVTTVGAVRDIENAIYKYVDENIKGNSISNLIPVDGTIVINNAEDDEKTIKVAISDNKKNALIAVENGLFVQALSAGDGIDIVDNNINVKLGANTHGLMAVDGALTLDLATKKSDGAMSKEDKLIVDSIPYAYVARKYDISGTPKGTLVNYGEKEIRVMCPVDAEFVKQNVGVGGDANTYYMTFKTYAPQDAVGYKEHIGNQSDGEILTDLKIDEHGRRYQPTWLGIAKFDDATGAWAYYGKNSAESKYIGWDYRIDWFDADGVMIDTDSIRINLSNEDCHSTNKPYYMVNYATSEEVISIKESVSDMSESYVWGEI